MANHKIIPEEIRFWSKVSINLGKVHLGTPCWEWTGAIHKGYGAFHGSGRRGFVWKSHRWSYLFCIGQIPEGFELDHLCRNRRCVNPWHLEPVTRLVNVLRGVSIASRNATKLYCKNGHLLTLGNIYLRPGTNIRQCKQCGLDNQRASRVRVGPANYKGSANPASKLTEKDVMRLRAERKTKPTAQIVKENPQWSWSTTWQAITGYSWAHLPGAVPQNRKCEKFKNKTKKGKEYHE